MSSASHVRSKQSADSKSPRSRFALMAVIAVVALLVPVGLFAVRGGDDTTATELTDYQVQLQGEVQYADGAPRTGRDPADQEQKSLEDVANAANAGAGARTDDIASGVEGSTHEHDVDAEEYLDNGNKAFFNGCAIGYGIPGEQCLPARAGGNKPLTCAYVIKHGFPRGIKVNKADLLKLDTNKNLVACGPGDKGVK